MRSGAGMVDDRDAGERRPARPCPWGPGQPPPRAGGRPPAQRLAGIGRDLMGARAVLDVHRVVRGRDDRRAGGRHAGGMDGAPEVASLARDEDLGLADRRPGERVHERLAELRPADRVRRAWSLRVARPAGSAMRRLHQRAHVGDERGRDAAPTERHQLTRERQREVHDVSEGGGRHRKQSSLNQAPPARRSAIAR